MTKFWGLYAVDRDLIYSKKHEQVIPPLQNHLLHTLPIFTALFDNYFNRHVYNKSFIRGCIPSFLYGSYYIMV